MKELFSGRTAWYDYVRKSFKFSVKHAPFSNTQEFDSFANYTYSLPLPRTASLLAIAWYAAAVPAA